MFKRTALFSLVGIVLMLTASAQPKVISLNEGSAGALKFTFYPTPAILQPTVSSAIIFTSGKLQTAFGLPKELNKKGMPVFVADSTIDATDIKSIIQYVKSNAAIYKVNTGRIGLIAIGDVRGVIKDASATAFVGLIDPVTKPDNISVTTPLLLSVNGGDNGNIIKFYNHFISQGGKSELHLHNSALADSVQYQEVIGWLDGLGLLKPVSTEKTAERKNADNWTAFAKMIDDRLHNDWSWIKRYEADNEKMPEPSPTEKRVVFIGNSITEGWINTDPEFFKTHGYINRGIGGQTTPQMLVRFREDVVNLHPKVVVILAGINDIAQNTGPNKLENVAGNIISMAEIAHANGIKVILCSVLPAAAFPWHPGIDPVNSIISLNRMLQAYAEKNKLAYVNYYDAVVDDKKAFKKELAVDGVHPNLAGYKIMEPLAEAVIHKILAER